MSATIIQFPVVKAANEWLQGIDDANDVWSLCGCAERTCEDTHCALVIANLNEFNNSGYEAMAMLCDHDHDLILWIENDGSGMFRTTMRGDVAVFRNKYL